MHEDSEGSPELVCVFILVAWLLKNLWLSLLKPKKLHIGSMAFTLVYEVLLKDSFAIIAKGHNVHEDNQEGLTHHLTKSGKMEEGITSNIARRDDYNGA